jgi:dienelactone hydrolase
MKLFSAAHASSVAAWVTMRCVARALTLATTLLWLAVPAVHAATPSTTDFASMREQVAALGDLKAPPTVHAAEGFTAAGPIKPLFFEGLPYRGKPTRVFAWFGLPAERSEKVPGVVLVHGGGGTAFKEWVQKWNEQGFAAISIAVEGQTDERIPGAPPGAQWKRHATAGPARTGVYGDSAAPLDDQWMYHAVADVVLANSLLRSLPEVDASRVGVCGISWGGIITSTVVGIDTRFAFGIPIYGCGALDRAAENYVRALRDNPLYREVWEPLLRLPRATMPLLWLTGPRDAHFPLDAQQASYRAAPGPRLVSVPFEMKHSHPAGWNPPDSYAFAKSVVETGRPWAREISQENRDGTARVTFAVTRPIRTAIVITKSGTEWAQTPATLEISSDRAVASAPLPADTTAYFFNLAADGPTLSSELQTVAPAAPRMTGAFPGFNWDRVPLYTHFGKRGADLTPPSSIFSPATRRSSRWKKATAQRARQHRGRHRRHPRASSSAATRAKVLFYFNAFINWGGYAAHSHLPRRVDAARPQGRNRQAPVRHTAPRSVAAGVSANGGRRSSPPRTARPRSTACLPTPCRRR